jgi:hypothetical protein
VNMNGLRTTACIQYRSRKGKWEERHTFVEEFMVVRKYARSGREQRSCGGTRVVRIADALRFSTDRGLRSGKHVAGSGAERSCRRAGRVVD